MQRHLLYLVALLLSCQNSCAFQTLLRPAWNSMEDKAVLLVANNPMLNQLDHSVLAPIAKSNHLVLFNKGVLWRHFQPVLQSYSLALLSPYSMFKFRYKLGDDDLMEAVCGAEKVRIVRRLDIIAQSLEDIQNDKELQGPPIRNAKFYPSAMYIAQVLHYCRNMPEVVPRNLSYTSSIFKSMGPQTREPFHSSTGFVMLDYYLKKDHPNIRLLGFNSTVPGYKASSDHHWKFEAQILNFLAEMQRLMLLHSQDLNLQK